ncbi:hypothetical protein O181_025627 [Austropuccinia psidii MF-1]|uniref:Small ribosomal subunit protein uS7 domain-containing protein n=1 Tax=Austropuccinia psidii MF-1 TaxID=1389203 RepID=A0A9Q3CNY2_9BASI|nr:hypothetical protein [Austropuccinia psidii MF-1]
MINPLQSRALPAELSGACLISSKIHISRVCSPGPLSHPRLRTGGVGAAAKKIFAPEAEAEQVQGIKTMKTSHSALLRTISSRLSLRPQDSFSWPSLYRSDLLESLWRKFSSTPNVRFAPTQHNLDRHPRARRLPAYEPPPPFPAPGDINAQLAYRDPRVSVPPPEEPLLDYMVGLFMRKGKRTIAQKHIVTLLGQLRLITGQEPFPLLAKAVQLASPIVVTRSEQKRLKVTTVPVALNETQRARKGILWMVKQSERRPGKKFGERLAMEVIAVLNGNSEVLKLKAEQHRLAFVNRANVRTRPTRA